MRTCPIPKPLKNAVRRGPNKVTCTQRYGESLGAGEIAEEMSAIELRVYRNEGPHHDLILPDGRRVDVIVTRGDVLPEVGDGVRAYFTEEEVGPTLDGCDVLYFVRIGAHANSMTFLGWMPVEEFFDQAEFVPKGSDDPFSRFAVRADCYVVDFAALRPPDTLNQ
jgi:hypothetical protein